MKCILWPLTTTFCGRLVYGGKMMSVFREMVTKAIGAIWTAEIMPQCDAAQWLVYYMEHTYAEF